MKSIAELYTVGLLTVQDGRKIRGGSGEAANKNVDGSIKMQSIVRAFLYIDGWFGREVRRKREGGAFPFRVERTGWDSNPRDGGTAYALSRRAP